jgi:hypothetical protein
MDKTSSWRADLILKTGVAAKKEQVEVSDCFGLFLVFNLKLLDKKLLLLVWLHDFCQRLFS